MDQATSLLHQAPFDDRTIAMFCRVLEDGWVEIGVHFVGRAAEKAGRMNIADGILGLDKTGQRDPQILKRYAVSRAHALLGPTGSYRLN
jgi:DNA transposition AAA+ family ATPase